VGLCLSLEVLKEAVILCCSSRNAFGALLVPFWCELLAVKMIEGNIRGPAGPRRAGGISVGIRCYTW